jgi:hypothetical protein
VKHNSVLGECIFLKKVKLTMHGIPDPRWTD